MSVESWSTDPVVELGEHDSLPAVIFRRAQADPKRVLLEIRSSVGAWRPMAFGDLPGHVTDLAAGLVARGVQPGHAVAILSPTSPEWMFLDLAIMSIGAVTVPVYESNSAVQIRHMLEDADVRLAFTATRQQAGLVESVAPNALRAVESFDQGALQKLVSDGHAVDGEAVRAMQAAVGTDDLATIVYTSGTTGVPKGVELTHRNMSSTALSCCDYLHEITMDPECKALLFLPMAHVLARIVLYTVVLGKVRIAFSPDTRNLLRDFAAVRPQAILAVPRVLEKVYDGAMAKAPSGLKQKIFSWSARQARQGAAAADHGDGPSIGMRARLATADALVLNKVKAAFGGNLKWVVCGGAPLSDDLGLFIQGLGVHIVQGYGLTETTGPVTVEDPLDHPLGCVGPPVPGNSIRIAEDGEVLAKGDSVFGRYHGLPEDTAENLTDGWFHTGDLGRLDDQGRLFLTGRKKELIVTAGGKNVSPEILENQLATHPLIGHVVVVGDGRKYIGALITLDPDMLPVWLQKKGLPPVSAAKAAQLPQVRKSLDDAIKRANKAVSRAESIRRYRIVDAEFTVENDYLTPSFKLKRSKVLRDFADEIDAMYAEGEREKGRS